MNKSSADFSAGFCFGVVLGAFIAVIVFGYFLIRPLNAELAEHQSLVVECEQHLPRNVYCELKAVVAFPEINEDKFTKEKQ